MSAWKAVVLAAGVGSRMRSRTPKVLHPLAGRPLIHHVLAQARDAGLPRPVVVVPPDAEAVREGVGNAADFAVQETPGGTGHALQCAQPMVEGEAEHVVVLYADVPLLRPETLRALMERHVEHDADLTFLTASESPQEGLGRVLRDDQGRVAAIVEAHEASGSEQAVREVNGGVYCFRARDLWTRLAELAPSSKGERYLTDLVALTLRDGGTVQTVSADDGQEVLGVNSRIDLAQAEACMRERVRRRWMLAGVTLVDPPSTFIDSDVEVGEDTVIYPNTHLYGATRVGAECHIGPNTVIQDSTVGEACRVIASMLEGAVLERGVEIGPFSHLRSGAHLERDVHIGNFVEVKKSRLGADAKAGHFTYIGDATIGARVNIGAGAITCNFDGVNKNPTTIEEDAFIGCDTMLVAPVTVGREAVTGAGAVVTKDVAPGSLVVGMPARSRGEPPSRRHAKE